MSNNFCRNRRNIMRGFAALAVDSALGYATSATANTRRIMVVPYEPGGLADRVGRAFTEPLFVGEARNWELRYIPGAAGLIGTAKVARRDIEGVSVVVTGSNIFRAHAAGLQDPGVSLNPLRELETVAILGEMPVLAVVAESNSHRSWIAYTAALRAARQPLMFGTVGYGSTSHILGSLLAQKAKLEPLLIPYRGSSSVALGVLSGEIPLAFLEPTTVIPLLAEGRVRVLGISTRRRLEGLRDTPTFYEQGLDVSLTSWIGLSTSRDQPSIVKSELTKYFESVSREVRVKSMLAPTMLSGEMRFGRVADETVGKDVNSFLQIVRGMNFPAL